ncbi:DUF6116 family protein [Orenia metallireducens]
MIVIFLIILIVYYALPKYLQFVVFLVNLFLPDIIPFVDELLMGLALIPRD